MVEAELCTHAHPPTANLGTGRSASAITSSIWVSLRLAVQGGCGLRDVAVDHDAAGHLERCACCRALLSQPHGQALEGSYEDNGIPSRDQGFRIDVCARCVIGIDCV